MFKPIYSFVLPYAPFFYFCLLDFGLTPSDRPRTCRTVTEGQRGASTRDGSVAVLRLVGITKYFFRLVYWVNSGDKDFVNLEDPLLVSSSASVKG